MAMILRLSDDEAEALRRQAAAEGRTTQEVGREAIRQYVARARRAKIDEAVSDVLERYADVLDRLGK